MIAGNREGIEESSSTKKRQLTDSSQPPTDESIAEEYLGTGDELNNDGKVEQWWNCLKQYVIDYIA